MRTVAIMGNGPVDHLPDLTTYTDKIDVWIGADRGALTLEEKGITVNDAVGDFDSMNAEQRKMFIEKNPHFDVYPTEKDKTDLEIAIQKALDFQPERMFLFGVTGGRLDHALINIQMLHPVLDTNVRAVIVDKWNQLELTTPGTYTVNNDEQYPYLSFIPFTRHVKHLTLTNFYYPLEGYHLSWGSTRCISNKLTSKKGTFSYKEGMLLFIKSRDAGIQ